MNLISPIGNCIALTQPVYNLKGERPPTDTLAPLSQRSAGNWRTDCVHASAVSALARCDAMRCYLLACARSGSSAYNATQAGETRNWCSDGSGHGCLGNPSADRPSTLDVRLRCFSGIFVRAAFPNRFGSRMRMSSKGPSYPNRCGSCHGRSTVFRRRPISERTAASSVERRLASRTNRQFQSTRQTYSRLPRSLVVVVEIVVVVVVVFAALLATWSAHCFISCMTLFTVDFTRCFFDGVSRCEV